MKLMDLEVTISSALKIAEDDKTTGETLRETIQSILQVLPYKIFSYDEKSGHFFGIGEDRCLLITGHVEEDGGYRLPTAEDWNDAVPVLLEHLTEYCQKTQEKISRRNRLIKILRKEKS